VHAEVFRFVEAVYLTVPQPEKP